MFQPKMFPELSGAAYDQRKEQTRALHQEYNTEQKCQDKLKIIDSWLETFSFPPPVEGDIVDQQVKSLTALKQQLERLLKIFATGRDRVANYDGELRDILDHIDVVNPQAKNQLANLQKRKTQLEQLVATIENPAGAGELQGIQTEVGSSYQDVVGGFFGEREQQHALVPSQNERILAEYYFAAYPPWEMNPEIRAQIKIFFLSQEYRGYKRRLNNKLKEASKLNESDTLTAFMESEFAKLATFQTPAEKEFFMEALFAFHNHVLAQKPGSPLDPELQNTYDSRAEDMDLKAEKAQIMKGESTGDESDRDARISVRAYEMFARYQLAKGAHHPDTALPSLALNRLYTAGQLPGLGLDNTTYAELYLGYNENGHYLNRVDQRGGLVQYIRGHRPDQGDQALAAAIELEMKKIAIELVPTLNAMKPQKAQSMIDAGMNLRVNPETKAVEFRSPDYDNMNQVGRVNHAQFDRKTQGRITDSIFGRAGVAPTFDVTKDLDGPHRFPIVHVMNAIEQKLAQLAGDVELVSKQLEELITWKAHLRQKFAELGKLQTAKIQLKNDIGGATGRWNPKTPSGRPLKTVEAELSDVRAKTEALNRYLAQIFQHLMQARRGLNLPHMDLNQTNIIQVIQDDTTHFHGKYKRLLTEGKALIQCYEGPVRSRLNVHLGEYAAANGKKESDPRFATLFMTLASNLKVLFAEQI